MNVSSIRIAFFDLDGTLIDSTGQIAPRVVNAIKKLSESGVKVALATGRP
ncbi:MAG: HAD family phosphatase, partial [Bdellovibrionales bacterium]|nr:HAD family phosphatase [Bdellovibrionales bacterium]